MVKGISKQVIVVHAPDPKMFEQAIFILKEDAVGKAEVTNDVLMQEARKILATPSGGRKHRFLGPLWALGGGTAVGIAWLLTVLL